MSRLLHYSYEPIPEVYSVEQNRQPYDKPMGLWVSVEGERDWPSFWRDQNPEHFQGWPVVTEILLKPDSQILQIGDELALGMFDRGYRRVMFPMDNPNSVLAIHQGIDWKKVAEIYQGVIISPYLNKARREVRWYETWDCASGCIWDVSAVQEIRQVEAENVELP